MASFGCHRPRCIQTEPFGTPTYPPTLIGGLFVESMESHDHSIGDGAAEGSPEPEQQEADDDGEPMKW